MSEPAPAWATDLGLTCTAWSAPGYIPQAEADALWADLSIDPQVTAPLEVSIPDGTFVADFGKTTFMDADLHARNAVPVALWGRTAPWSAALAALRDRLVTDLGQPFRVCVALHYPHGNVAMDYHSDQQAYGDTSWIASLSLGAPRTFALRENATHRGHRMVMTHGSLIVMGPGCQDTYQHAILPDPECSSARINLTFRMFDD